MLTKICLAASVLFSSSLANEKEAEAYSVQSLHFGATDEENLNDFGVITNFYDGDLTQEIADLDHLAVVYVTDSAWVTDTEHMSSTIHHAIMQPVAEELKGFAHFYVYDCSHPKTREHVSENSQFYLQYLQTCGAHNEAGSPSFILFKQPEQRLNPYTGEEMKKQMI